MKRQVSLEEISDGRLYERHDMVRIGCGGCRGCSSCCHGMGESAILDPLDVHRLVQGTGLSFDELLEEYLELNVVDGVILPNLNMKGKDEACHFLNEEGRCRIHPFRPGVCRLFPLGRYYLSADNSRQKQLSPVEGSDSDGSASEPLRQKDSARGAAVRNASSFRYFLQVNECPAPNKTKVRLEKWLDQPDLPRYEEYILRWHNFLEQVEAFVSAEKEEDAVKNINLLILKRFFFLPFDPDVDFYAQFEERLSTVEIGI